MPADQFYFDIRADGLAVFLGPTEARLMELSWLHKSLTVKSALLFLGEDHPLAYTTVMTVLNRLSEKGLLTRDKDGRNFVYHPAISRENFLRSRIAEVQNCLRRNFSSQDDLMH